MTEPDVAALAAKLTKAQRRWLKEGAHGDIGMTMVRRLIGKGLWYIKADSPDGKWGFAEPTPLGQRVRQHLLSAQQSERGE